MMGAIVSWINSKGRLQVKSFDSMVDAIEFMKCLDRRVERGTCGGYILTECKDGD